MGSLISNPRVRVALGIALAAALVAGGWCAWQAWLPHASQITVTTDRTWYRQGDTVLVTIRNRGSHEVEVYVPDFCAIGNFAALIQVRSEDGWRGNSAHGAYAASLPATIDFSISGPGVRTMLAPASSLVMRLPDIRLHGSRAGEQTMRVAFYVIDRKHLVYSNEFTVAP